MKTQPTTSKSGGLPRFLRATPIAGLLPALFFLLSIQSSFAGSAKWKASPASGDWNTAGNWTAGGPPNGSADTATFASSSMTGVSLSLNTEVNGIVFNAGASAFTITARPAFQLTVSGVGITNNSGIMQNIVAAPDSSGNLFPIQFLNSATAGSSTMFTAGGASDGYGPYIEFFGASTAGNATFIINGGVASLAGAGGTLFFDTSTAGNGIFTANGGTVSGGLGSYIEFFGASTAGNATFTSNAGVASSAQSGATLFFDTSTAGNGIFTANGATVSGGFESYVQFFDTSTAGNGIFTANGATVSGGFGSYIQFFDTSTASTATLIANGGSGGGEGSAISLNDDSTGGTARVEVFGNGTGDITNGNLDISAHNAPGAAIGSLEGSGAVFLGANKLTVGSGNLSTAFSGVILDGGLGGGTGGSFTKIGTGTLTLAGASTYTGGTTVSAGTLLITSRSGSGTGTGPVQVNAGTLGGTGKISGAVTIGTTTAVGRLAPGSGVRPGKLSLSKTLTFNAKGNYKVDLNSTLVTADQVAAKGVAINSGATVTIGDLGTGTLTAGTVFTVINNTAPTPIAGTFSNLADGSRLIVGSNTYKANYEGGTGNDLTLTVQ